VSLQDVLLEADIENLTEIWKNYHDDLSWPWYDRKPDFLDHEFILFLDSAQKVVDAMSNTYKMPLVLDHAIISATNRLGDPPHADNVQFDSVWWEGRQIKQKDELVAIQGGAEVLWRPSKTSYRNYCASISLVESWTYGGGDLEFYTNWGDRVPASVHRCRSGSGVAFCGCQKNVHAVTSIEWGFRLVLLVWTRPAGTQSPEDQKTVCHFRQGTGRSVWLTTADLEHYPKRRRTSICS